MAEMLQETPSVILIAPNVSTRMGGEAIKSLQIYSSLSDRGIKVHQITHSRVRGELSKTYPEMNVSYVEEDRLDSFLWKTKILKYFGHPYFMWRAAKIARKMIEDDPTVIVHYTSPISPVAPIFSIKGARVIVGPLNGNIHHPSAFRSRESLSDRVRRLMLYPSQYFFRAFSSGKKEATTILVAGGARTYQSLRIAGCRPEQFRDSLDSGIPDKLRSLPLMEHHGPNFRFVHNGRLVPYKGTDLAIKAVARSRNPVTLDVIGQGPAHDSLVELAGRLGVGDRVRFLGWMNQEEMYPALRSYRAFVFPSLAEANGIVVQEAMMLGLPVICADWGGPSLLVTPETGIAIPPDDEEALVSGLARAMDRLGEDGDLAQQMAEAGRRVALDRGFTWADLIDQWVEVYRHVGNTTAGVVSRSWPPATIG